MFRKEMKYALIGCGRIAINHLRAAINNNFEIVALCDLMPDKIELLIKKAGFKRPVSRFTDYKEMIEQTKDIELVSIATDSGAHAEVALYCINKGINVIIEKPIAMNLDDADKIIELASKKGVKVSTCHQNRFNVAVQEVKKALDLGRFGKLSHGSINIRWNRDKDYYDQASWRGKWATDGGALMNQCIHGIDLLRWMFGGEIVEVFGATRQQFHDYLECEDVGMAVVKFKNGAIATIEGTVNVYPKNLEETLYIFGESGTIKLGGTSCNNIDIWSFSSCDNLDGERSQIKEQTSNVYGNGHTSLFADMASAIKENRTPYVDGIAGRNALELVLAIYKSQLTDEVVKLPLKHFASTDMAGIFGKTKVENR